MQEMDESLERENYEHSNSLEYCQSCLVRLIDVEICGLIVETICPICKQWKILKILTMGVEND